MLSGETYEEQAKTGCKHFFQVEKGEKNARENLHTFQIWFYIRATASI